MKDEHEGFHSSCGDKQGLFYGREKVDKSKRKYYDCEVYVEGAKIEPYVLIRQGKRIPAVYYDIYGTQDHCQATLFGLRLKGLGVPVQPTLTPDLTNFAAHHHNFEAYEEPGYAIVEGKGGEKEFKLITLEATYRHFGDEEWERKELKEVLPDLAKLYQLTVDKTAFLMSFSLMLFSPFSALVRSKRQYFPNVIYMGLPETGKNSLLNLFLAKAWNLEENILATGDFKKDFTSMVNIEGEGPPVVVNDITQSSYESLKPYLTEGAMNPRSGSRGQKELNTRKYYSTKMVALSANYLQIGGPEMVSRFMVHVLRENDLADASAWNETAAKLDGMAYPIARFFLDFIKKKIPVDVFLDYFTESRSSVKDTILKLGWQVLTELLRMAGVEQPIPRALYDYEEYQEDSMSLFMGWVQLALRKMQRETNYYEKDYDARSTVTVRYEDSLYIREDSNDYTIFMMAWTEFQRKYPDFPYKSMNAFAKAYPAYLSYANRKFKTNKLADDRTSFWVLKLRKMVDEVVEVQPEQKVIQ